MNSTEHKRTKDLTLKWGPERYLKKLGAALHGGGSGSFTTWSLNSAGSDL